MQMDLVFVFPDNAELLYNEKYFNFKETSSPKACKWKTILRHSLPGPTFCLFTSMTEVTFEGLPLP